MPQANPSKGQRISDSFSYRLVESNGQLSSEVYTTRFVYNYRFIDTRHAVGTPILDDRNNRFFLRMRDNTKNSSYQGYYQKFDFRRRRWRTMIYDNVQLDEFSQRGNELTTYVTRNGFDVRREFFRGRLVVRTVVRAGRYTVGSRPRQFRFINGRIERRRIPSTLMT